MSVAGAVMVALLQSALPPVRDLEAVADASSATGLVSHVIVFLSAFVVVVIVVILMSLIADVAVAAVVVDGYDVPSA